MYPKFWFILSMPTKRFNITMFWVYHMIKLILIHNAVRYLEHNYLFFTQSGFIPKKLKNNFDYSKKLTKIYI